MSGKFDMMSLIKKAKEKDAQLTSSKNGNKNKKSKKRKLDATGGDTSNLDDGEKTEPVECKCSEYFGWYYMFCYTYRCTKPLMC